ncbi:ankyrin repeat-containing domain protein [Neocallimastix lanati (nom. inval.)]|nr:ankyrin repeat-containing domain protein [Neocallimastix sp. JGI-2020a]
MVMIIKNFIVCSLSNDKNYNGIAIYLIDKNIDIYGNSNIDPDFEEIINFLIENGVNIKDESKIQLLVKNGINIILKNHNGNNALIMASMASSIDIVKYLIKCGIDINDQINNRGNTLTLEIINYLVSNEIDINHTTKYGYNALFSFQHLVEKGIDINCRNSPKSETDRFCWISF